MKRVLSVILSLIILTAAFPLSAYAAVKAPATPKVTASSTVSSVTLKWKKVSGASGYEVYSYSKKKYKKIAAVTKLKYTKSKLSAGTSYIYAVRAYKKVGKVKKYSKYSKLVKVSTKPKKPGGLYIKDSTYASFTVGWSKVSGATGYTVYYSTDSSLKSGVKTAETSTNSIRIKNLNDNTSYYYNVQAYRIYNKKKYVSAVSDKAFAVTKEIPSKYKTTVNTAKTYQTVNGFGASAAWNYQRFGNWETAEDILTYLYDKNKGIGLNIYRYNVGAGSKDDETMGSIWNRTEGFISGVDFESGAISYDFTSDAAAQNCLRIAKKLAGNDLRVTLFHNSPPVELTENGKAYCTGNGATEAEDMASNLDPSRYPLYAKFCVDVADYFVKSGYRVTDISPMNEPIYDWAGSNQEGCHFTPSQASALYAQMINAAKGKPYKISMFEMGAAEAEIEDGKETLINRYLAAIMDNKTNSAYFDSVSMHSYWSNKERKELCRDFINSRYPGMNIACTEYCQMYNDWSTGVHDISEQVAGTKEANGYEIVYGLEMARTVYEDLTALNATEWSWWLGVSTGYYPDGLVYIDNQGIDHNVIETTKRLWCLGNFSKFINEGAKRADVSTIEGKLLSTAFINKNGSVVIVFINRNAKALTTNICLKGFNNYKAYETSAVKDLALVKSGEFENGTALSVPAESVVSVIVTK